MRRAEAVAAAVARLAAAGVADPIGDARRLMRWATGLDAAALSARMDDALTPREGERFETGLSRRAGRAPLSHVTGVREFWGRPFGVTAAVLDPRPETETLIAAALEGGPRGRVLDLGVGSGCILLTLLAEWPQATGVGVDASAGALAVATANAAALGVADRAEWRRGDWLAGVQGPFDLVAANPPYLTDDDMARLQPELRAEPAEALAAGPDGLDAYRRILPALARILAPRGKALFEAGAGQAEAVAQIGRRCGLAPRAVRRDFDDRARVVVFSAESGAD